MRAILIILHTMAIGFFCLLCYCLWKEPSVLGALILLWYVWAVLPIKHPCDYPSYSAWWADRKNGINYDSKNSHPLYE